MSLTLEQEIDAVRPTFDPTFYLLEYPDITCSAEEAITHFCERGWREGRNPNPFFDITFFLLRNKDVAAAGINPYAHFVKYGRYEHREFLPSATPSVRSGLLFDYPVFNWVEQIAPYVDLRYYKSQLGELRRSKINFVAHFAFRGWREGLSPSRKFNVADWLLQYPIIEQLAVNPALVHAEISAGRFSQEQLEIMSSVAGLQSQGDDIAPSSDDDLAMEIIKEEFSASFYLEKYSDVAERGIDPLVHYFYFGWKEGRNPNEEFDTNFYLSTNPDVAEAGIMPFWHYLVAGRAEGRSGRRPDTVAVKTPATELQHYLADEAEQLEIIGHEFSSSFYLDRYADVAKEGVDPLTHYFYTGWKEGRDPCDTFSTTYYLSVNEDVRDAGVMPFLHYLVVGRAEGRAGQRPDGEAGGSGEAVRSSQTATQAINTLAQDSGGVSDENKLEIIKREFSEAYYLEIYPDIADSGIDPLTHYFYTGWKEGRNPCYAFDPAYYLSANEDVRSAGVEPFWHYLVAGRAEGRLGRRPGGYRREVIDAARDPTERSASYVTTLDRPILSKKPLSRALGRLLKGRKGLVISVSHDAYIGVFGGTQIFIADEQSRFNQENYAYLHLSPLVARLEFAPEGSEQITRLIGDGSLLGYVDLQDVIDWFAKTGRISCPDMLFVIHCVFGFTVSALCDLFASTSPRRSFFWTHDYSSICAGYNLLRDDVEYCGAPSADSMACRICVYGPSRPTHQKAVERLFATCGFEVLSPSEFTLDLWRRSAQLPCKRATVHHHWRIEREPEPVPVSDLEAPVSLAFIGFTSAHKGWPIFSDLVRRLEDDDRYQFYHFAVKSAHCMKATIQVVTEVTPTDRLAAVRQLSENQIDFVLMLSAWPETFSFVAYEALAAGAHLICFPESGNVADLVRRTGRGVVLPDADAILKFLVSGEAVQYAAEWRSRRFLFKIDNIGTTATVDEILTVSA